MISNISYIISINILLGAPTIGRGSAWPSGGGGWSQRSQIRRQSRSNNSKRHKNGRFPTLIDFKIGLNLL
jgi:hypothetical protein